MATLHIDSFVDQFKKLWGAGIEASLNVESKLGEVYVSLNCKVGRITPPSPASQSPFLRPKYRSPSYYRRQERRKEERELMNVSSVESSTLKAEEAMDVESSRKTAVIHYVQDASNESSLSNNVFEASAEQACLITSNEPAVDKVNYEADINRSTENNKETEEVDDCQFKLAEKEAQAIELEPRHREESATNAVMSQLSKNVTVARYDRSSSALDNLASLTQRLESMM